MILLYIPFAPIVNILAPKISDWVPLQLESNPVI